MSLLLKFNSRLLLCFLTFLPETCHQGDVPLKLLHFKQNLSLTLGILHTLWPGGGGGGGGDSGGGGGVRIRPAVSRAPQVRGGYSLRTAVGVTVIQQC